MAQHVSSTRAVKGKPAVAAVAAKPATHTFTFTQSEVDFLTKLVGLTTGDTSWDIYKVIEPKANDSGVDKFRFLHRGNTCNFLTTVGG